MQSFTGKRQTRSVLWHYGRVSPVQGMTAGLCVVPGGRVLGLKSVAYLGGAMLLSQLTVAASGWVVILPVLISYLQKGTERQPEGTGDHTQTHTESRSNRRATSANGLKTTEKLSLHFNLHVYPQGITFE